MTSRIWIWALVLPLALSPQPARSQCCTMPSGAGGHERMGGESSNERKARKEIDRLLSSEMSRGLLMEALLQDREFTEMYIGRIAEQAEWRAVAQKKLAVGRDKRSGDEGRMSAGRPAPRSTGEQRFRLSVDGGGFRFPHDSRRQAHHARRYADIGQHVCQGGRVSVVERDA